MAELTFEAFKRCMIMIPNTELIEIGAKIGIKRKYSIIFTDFVEMISAQIWLNRHTVAEIMNDHKRIFANYSFNEFAIEVDKFTVIYHGDPKVGIFNQEWHIEGDFTFDTIEDFDAFVKKLKEAWEYASDTPVEVEASGPTFVAESPYLSIPDDEQQDRQDESDFINDHMKK